MRNQTYAHLQRLSLEFFGRRRTGDLIDDVPWLDRASRRIMEFYL
jgi:ABC-type multidrug transport system fused ATPase/permease subunit